MLKLIEKVCEDLVDNPEEVKVREVQGERMVMYEITCNNEDIGKLLGRQGRNINALRTLTKSIAAKNKKYVEVEVIGT